MLEPRQKLAVARVPPKPRPSEVRAALRNQRALAALTHLRQVDERLARLIEQIGQFSPLISPDPFRTLVLSILQQQVSMAAAEAIHRRVRALCPNGRITPERIRRLRAPQLRRAGLSRQKATYLRHLAAAFASGELSRKKLAALEDEEVVTAVTRVHGIGRWTAEMLLIFCLERPDVWPVDDLGLRKAVGRLLGQREVPPARAIRDVGAAWRPYRTYATWYLWRSLEGPRMAGAPLDPSAPRPRAAALPAAARADAGADAVDDAQDNVQYDARRAPRP